MCFGKCDQYCLFIIYFIGVLHRTQEYFTYGGGGVWGGGGEAANGRNPLLPTDLPTYDCRGRQHDRELKYICLA